MAAPSNRRHRRALKRAGVEVMHTVTIEGAAIAAAVVQGIDVVDLVMFNVDTALRALEAEGGDILTHAVVTIGRHPDHPDDLTVQAKTASRKIMVRACRVCGCTDADCSQCVAKTGAPCSWVEVDLCSACVGEPEAKAAPA